MSQDYTMNYADQTVQRYSDVDVFSTEGRIGRKRYFVYSIIIPAIIFWGIASIATFLSYLPVVNTQIYYGFVGVAIVAALIAMVMLTIQRCHDINKHGSLAVLALIPLANIVFSLIPGTNGLNQYGETPKPTSSVFKIGFYVLIIAILGLGVYFTSQLINADSINALINRYI